MNEVTTKMVIATPRCPQCGQADTMQILAEGYDRWVSGATIQDAFPDLTREVREQLLTGYHPACWDTAFGGWEED